MCFLEYIESKFQLVFKYIFTNSIQIVSILFLIIFILSPLPVRADSESSQYAYSMLEWRDKSLKAESFLLQGDQELKKGLRYKGCLNYKKANQFAQDAYKALIIAQQYNDEDKELIAIKNNLDHLSELARCSTANSLFQQ